MVQKLKNMDKHYYRLVLMSLIPYYYALVIHESPANQCGNMLYVLEQVNQSLNKRERLTKHLSTISPLSEQYTQHYQDYADLVTILNRIRFIRFAIKNGKQYSPQELSNVHVFMQQIKQIADDSQFKIQRLQYNIQRLQKLL